MTATWSIKYSMACLYNTQLFIVLHPYDQEIDVYLLDPQSTITSSRRDSADSILHNLSIGTMWCTHLRYRCHVGSCTSPGTVAVGVDMASHNGSTTGSVEASDSKSIITCYAVFHDKRNDEIQTSFIVGAGGEIPLRIVDSVQQGCPANNATTERHL